MTILQVISFLYPAWSYGGPGKLVYELAASFVKREHSVTVFSTDAYDATRRRNSADNAQLLSNPSVRFHFFPNVSNVLAFRYKAFLPVVNIRGFFTIIACADAIHIHEFFTPLVILTVWVASQNRVPVFISAHGTLDSFHLRHRPLAKSLFFRLFGTRILKSARFIAATQEEEREYERLGIAKERITHVRNGIDLSVFDILPKRGAFRREQGVGEAVPMLLFLGRINKLKGLDTLLRAFALLNKRLCAVLVVAGSEDGYMETAKTFVAQLGLEKQVLFPGPLAGHEKLQAYRDSDLFVYPSPREGFSLAILEAAACGLPLVITRGCKFDDVGKKQAGIIVEPDNEKALSEALEELLIDKKKRRTMGKNARSLARGGYSIDRMAEQLEIVYSTTRYQLKAKS